MEAGEVPAVDVKKPEASPMGAKVWGKAADGLSKDFEAESEMTWSFPDTPAVDTQTPQATPTDTEEGETESEAALSPPKPVLTIAAAGSSVPPPSFAITLAATGSAPPQGNVESPEPEAAEIPDGFTSHDNPLKEHE